MSLFSGGLQDFLCDFLSLNVMHLGDLGGSLREFEIILFVVLNFLDLWFNIFHYIWKLHGYYFILLVPHFSSLSGILTDICYTISYFPNTLRCSVVFFSFSLCHLVWVISSDLYLSSFILSTIVLCWLYWWAHQRHS